MTVWAPVDAAEPETEYRWLARVWLLVAAFAVVTLLRSEQVGIGLKDPHGEILRSRVALSLGLFLVLALGDAWLRAGRTDRSARRVLEVLRQRWPRRRLALAGGPAGLLPRLLLLPQPEELGRPQQPPRRHAAGLGPVAVPRSQPRRPAARPARATTSPRTS